nr:hypothetical protein [uncultured Allomuricauda sp.]
MKLLLICIGIIIIGSASAGIKETKVYICMGKGSKKYHYNKNCRGFSNCSTKIHEVTLEKAKDMGRTLCGWED